MKTFLFLSVLSWLSIQALNAQTTPLTTRHDSISICFPEEELPEYPGGMMAMRTFLSNNLIYPQIAKDSAYEGKCYLRFIIDTGGYIKDISLLKGLRHCADCDQEAIRLLKAMPRWKPGKRNGKPVNVYFNIPIEFKIM